MKCRKCGNETGDARRYCQDCLKAWCDLRVAAADEALRILGKTSIQQVCEDGGKEGLAELQRLAKKIRLEMERAAMSGRHGMVEWFADQMGRAIRINAYKGRIPFKATYGHLMGRTLEELAELSEELLKGKEIDLDKLIDECADTANFLMFIADKAARERDKAE